MERAQINIVVLQDCKNFIEFLFFVIFVTNEIIPWCASVRVNRTDINIHVFFHTHPHVCGQDFSVPSHDALMQES